MKSKLRNEIERTMWKSSCRICWVIGIRSNPEQLISKCKSPENNTHKTNTTENRSLALCHAIKVLFPAELHLRVVNCWPWLRFTHIPKEKKYSTGFWIRFTRIKISAANKLYYEKLNIYSVKYVLNAVGYITSAEFFYVRFCTSNTLSCKQ